MRALTTAALVAMAGLTAASTAAPPSAEKPTTKAAAPQPRRCTDLANLSVPGFVIKITKAAPVAAEGPVPAHCLVEGDIDPRVGLNGKPYALGFAIALPDEWSGRFMFQGGGGYNGVVRRPLSNQTGGPSALARGFAVVSTDSGHKGGTPAFLEDQQAALDFAHDSVGKVTQVGKRIAETYYGRSPHHTYFSGCSNGGREAMLAAQRYPNMFDGVVAGDPGMRSENTRLTASWAVTVFNRAAPKDASGKPQLDKLFTDADRKLVLGRLLDSCDGLDGMKDGLIFNAAACRFDPATLVCKGAKNDTCLTRVQAQAIKTAIASPKTRGGIPFYAPYPYDTGLVAGRFMPGAQLAAMGPLSNDVDMDIDQAALQVALDGAWQLVATAGWTNYSTFFGRGGKLIFTNSMSDPAFSAIDTTEYYKRLLKDNGGREAARGSSRLFLIPGRGHCGGGAVTLTQFDTLDAIVNWVEQGRAPDAILASVSNAPDHKRPLCAWPAYAHYKGTGDPKDAASYECRQP